MRLLEAPCFGGPLDGQVAASLSTYLEVPLESKLAWDGADDNPVAIGVKRGVYRFERQRLAWTDLGHVLHEYRVEAWVFTTPYERYEAERQRLMDSLLFICQTSLLFATRPRWPGHHEWVRAWQMKRLAYGRSLHLDPDAPMCRWCFQPRFHATEGCRDAASIVIEARERHGES